MKFDSVSHMACLLKFVSNQIYAQWLQYALFTFCRNQKWNKQISIETEPKDATELEMQENMALLFENKAEETEG